MLKKINTLDHQRLKELVYVKYNPIWKECFVCRDAIDPILYNIEDSSEWLLGELGDKNGEAQPNLVLFELVRC